MKEVTFHIPDDSSALSVDIAVHFNSDLEACENFAKFAQELGEKPHTSFGGSQVLIEVEPDVEGELRSAEVTYYGPSIIDRPDEDADASSLLHARTMQLRAREADKRAASRTSDEE